MDCHEQRNVSPQTGLGMLAFLRRGVLFIGAPAAACLLLSCFDGGGETRRFDQYPSLLAIEGDGVVEAGQDFGLLLLADNDFTPNPDASFENTHGVDVDSVLPMQQGRPMLACIQDRCDAHLGATAPAVSAVTSYRIRAHNPRSEVVREVFVVPAGTLHVKSLRLARDVLLAGDSLQATVELSGNMAPGEMVEVALAASTTQLTLPARVTVTAPARQAQFTVGGGAIQGEAYLQVSATLNGATQSTGLWLRQAEPFLRHLAVPSLIRTDAAAGSSAEGVASLSAPALTAATLALASNNDLVQVPASVPVEAGQREVRFPIETRPFGGFSAVRFTASFGGTQKVADASLGFRPGDAQLKRLVVDGESGSIAGERLNFSCEFQLLRDPFYGHVENSRIAFIDLELEKPAPPDARIEIFSSRRSAVATGAVVIVPAGSTRLSLRLAVEPGALIGDVLRYLRLGARVMSTGQVLSEPIYAATRDGLDRSSSIASVAPQDPSSGFVAGSVARFVVSVDEVHPYDDVPFRLSLHDRGSGARLAFVDTVVFAGMAGRAVELPLPMAPPGAAVEVRARLGSPRSDGGWCVEQRTTPSFAFELQAAPVGLAEIRPHTPALFAGESTEVSVRLGQAAAADTRVAITSSLAGGVLAGVPAEVLIPAGRTTASFTVTAAVNTTTVSSGALMAQLGGDTRSGVLHVLPEPADLRLAIAPVAANAGQPVTLRVEVDPVYPVPMPVSLSSDRTAVPVPAVLAIEANAGFATAALNVGPVVAPDTATLTARLRGVVAKQTLAISPAPSPPGGWQTLAGDIAASLEREVRSSVALDSTGLACIAYVQEVGGEGRLSVRREGSGFAPLIPLFTTAARDVRLVVDAGDAPVIVFTLGGSDIVLARWTGAGWNMLSSRANLTTGSATRPRIARFGSTLVLAWIEAGQLVVRRHDLATGQWDAGAFVPGIVNPFDLDLALDSNGRAIVAWSEGLLGRTLRASRETDSGTWAPLGGDIGTRPVPGPQVMEFGVHVDASDVVRIAWIDGDANYYLQLAQFNGTNWGPLPGRTGTLFSQSSGQTPIRTLSVNRDRTLFAFAYAMDRGVNAESVVAVQQLKTGGLTPVGPDFQTIHPRVGHLSLAMRGPDSATLTQSQFTSSGGTDRYALAVRRHVP